MIDYKNLSFAGFFLPKGWMRSTVWFDKIVWNNFGRPHGRAEGRAPGMGRAFRRFWDSEAVTKPVSNSRHDRP